MLALFPQQINISPTKAYVVKEHKLVIKRN